MEITWGPRDQFGVRLVFIHGVARRPKRRLRVEQRDVRHDGVWRPTFTLYDDMDGALLGHYANIAQLDRALDALGESAAREGG